MCDAALFVSPYQDRIRADGGLTLSDLRLRVLDSANERDAAGGPLAAAFERASNARGMTVMLGTQPYERNDFGAIDLPDDVTFVVQEAYHGIDDDQRPFIDDRVVPAVSEDAKSFWPVVLRLDREIVTALADELRDAVKRRAM